jgi:hypothetical protein
MSIHLCIHERESLNRSQMDIKLKIRDIRTWEKHRYSCPVALPMRRDPQVFWLLSQPFLHLHFNLFVISDTFATELWTALRDKHRKQETFLYEYFCIVYFCQQTTHERNLLFGNALLKNGGHFNYWNQPLNMRMRIWYLDCQEAGLCCYLEIQIENLLRPLQLFYFHFSPIYWLSLVIGLYVSSRLGVGRKADDLAL